MTRARAVIEGNSGFIAQKRAAEEQRRQFEQTRRDMNPWLSGLGSLGVLTYEPIRGVPDPSPTSYTPGPCGGCGSRETVIHDGARMCAYCRGDR